MNVKKFSLASLAVTAALVSGAVSAQTLDWATWSNVVTVTPGVAGDKTFTFENGSDNGGWGANVSATFAETSGVYTALFSPQTSVTATNSFLYRVEIDPAAIGQVFNTFNMNQTTLNSNGNVSTKTQIFTSNITTDANKLWDSGLISGPGASGTYTFAGSYTTIYIYTQTFGVSAAANSQLSSIVDSFTQRTEVVPEIDALAGTGALTLLAGALALAGERRRRG